MLRALIWTWGASALACTCVTSASERVPAPHASIVFRGTVSAVDRLPEHPKMRGRQRYVVTLRVEESWRGSVGSVITLYDLDPGTDCMGRTFVKGEEYLIFALEQESRDYELDSDNFWHGWTDVQPKGSKMVRELSCTPGGETSRDPVREALKRLGKGKKHRR
jgi:hypothetical protein